MENLTLEQQATNYQTQKHISLVQHHLHTVVKHLLERAENHDKSKLEEPEVQGFTEGTAKLSRLTYGSDEYKKQIKEGELGRAVAHHYSKNRHHVRDWVGGIHDGVWHAVVKRYYAEFFNLVDANDGGVKFKTIANFIEAHLEAEYTPPSKRKKSA